MCLLSFRFSLAPLLVSSLGPPYRAVHTSAATRMLMWATRTCSGCVRSAGITTPVLKPVGSVFVVELALVVVGQDIIRLVDTPDFHSSLLVTRIEVRVVLPHQLAPSLAYIFLAGVPANAQLLVVIVDRVYLQSSDVYSRMAHRPISRVGGHKGDHQLVSTGVRILRVSSQQCANTEQQHKSAPIECRGSHGESPKRRPLQIRVRRGPFVCRGKYRQHHAK